MNPLEIAANAETVIEDIRNYSRSQKEIWQRIPRLALEAEGRGLGSNNFSRAYLHGVWALSNKECDRYPVAYIDLATGELVDTYIDGYTSYCGHIKGLGIPDIPKEIEIRPANDKVVLNLVFRLDDLNAKKIVTGLKRIARLASPDPTQKDIFEAWRTELREKFHLPEFYVR